jgi:V/A-type H+-transporting ATPase subunit E
MALNDVTAEIRNLADNDVKAIEAETAQEIARMQSETEAKIAGLKESEDKRLADALARMERQEASSAELESKKIVLAKKKEILSSVFDETLAELEDADPKDKLKHYVKMVAYAKTIIPEPRVIMSKDDKFTAKQLDVLEVKRDAKIKGGLIIQSEDGQIEIDMQYSALLRTVWDGGIKDVSDILFG